MPPRTPRACRKQGCRGTTTARHGYCDACKPIENGWAQNERRKGNRHQRGYGNDWERLRKQVLTRDKGLCQACLRAGRYESATTVDHIKAKAHGGTDALSNLEALCTACHSRKTATERLKGRGGSNL